MTHNYTISTKNTHKNSTEEWSSTLQHNTPSITHVAEHTGRRTQRPQNTARAQGPRPPGIQHTEASRPRHRPYLGRSPALLRCQCGSFPAARPPA